MMMMMMMIQFISTRYVVDDDCERYIHDDSFSNRCNGDDDESFPPVALCSMSIIMSAIFGRHRAGMFRQVLTFAAWSERSSGEIPSKSRCANPFSYACCSGWSVFDEA